MEYSKLEWVDLNMRNSVVDGPSPPKMATSYANRPETVQNWAAIAAWPINVISPALLPGGVSLSPADFGTKFSPKHKDKQHTVNKPSTCPSSN